MANSKISSYSFVIPFYNGSGNARSRIAVMDKPLDAEQSRAIAEQLKGKKSSFETTAEAVVLVDGALYVQGFVVYAGAPYRPVEHSWLELDDRIIDPSLPKLSRKPEQLFYFPAQRLTAKKLKAAIEEAQEDYPEDDPLPIYGSAPYEYYGDVMLGGKEYQTAFEAADAKSKELNRPRKSENGKA